MKSANWAPARARYQQLLDQYPHDPRAGRAKDGVHAATLKIELDRVRDLLDGPGTPRYCAHPAKYGGAPAYGPGTNRALFFGNDHYTGKLPHGWTAGDATAWTPGRTPTSTSARPAGTYATRSPRCSSADRRHSA